MRYQTIQSSIQNAFTDGFFSPLSIANYRRILSSNSLWWASFYMEHIAMGWMVLELTDSALMVSIVEFFRRLPFLILGFLAGPIIDRVGRHQSIVFTSIADICLYMLLAVLIWSESLEIWHIYVYVGTNSIFKAFQFPAFSATVSQLVPKEHLGRASGMVNAAESLAQHAGQPPRHDDAKLRALGIRKVEGRHLTLYTDLRTDQAANDHVAEFVRGKIREVVDDPEVFSTPS